MRTLAIVFILILIVPAVLAQSQTPPPGQTLSELQRQVGLPCDPPKSGKDEYCYFGTLTDQQLADAWAFIIDLTDPCLVPGCEILIEVSVETAGVCTRISQGEPRVSRGRKVRLAWRRECEPKRR